MAVIAIHAVVDIATNSPVSGIGLRFEVAVGALEDSVVVGIGVTCCTHTVGAPMVQGEEGMVKRGTQPTGGVVTGLASCWEPGRSMGRIGRPLVIRFVTRVAVRRSIAEIVIDVTTGTLNLGVRSGQGKRGEIVIEGSRNPTGGAMADIALLRKPAGNVIRIGGALKILQVTSDASSLRALIPSSDVTGHAVQPGVHSSQGIAGHSQVIKLGAGPGINGVALFAGGGKCGGHVIGRGGPLVILGVTGVALERQTLELPGGGSFMTGIAFQGRMRSHQGEAILVVLYRLQGDRPAAHVVTTFAIGAHLAAMDVGVAGGAPCSGVGEHHLGMASSTRHPLVRAD